MISRTTEQKRCYKEEICKVWSLSHCRLLFTSLFTKVLISHPREWHETNISKFDVMNILLNFMCLCWCYWLNMVFKPELTCYWGNMRSSQRAWKVKPNPTNPTNPTRPTWVEARSSKIITYNTEPKCNQTRKTKQTNKGQILPEKGAQCVHVCFNVSHAVISLLCSLHVLASLFLPHYHLSFITHKADNTLT